MKKILLLSHLIIVFLLSTTLRTQASHFAGADLTYKCLGGNDYLVTFTFYRDCSGSPEPTTVQAAFTCSSNSTYNFNATLTSVSGSGNEITFGCSAVPTKCSGGTNYGIKEYVYQAQVSLIPCNYWKISYNLCCRNPITTVPNNSTFDGYMMAILNNLDAPCNSSPIFSNKPIIAAFINQQNCFNQGTSDINGDSLVYSFYSPFINSSSSVTYALPYSHTNFLNSSTPITIDSITGDVCFSPTTCLTTLTGIKVEEYRKINNVYTLIGTVYRDMQLKVDYANSFPPILSGIDTFNTHVYNPYDTIYSMETCYFPGKLISFDMVGFDADTFNNMVIGSPEKFSITWNNGIPQGSFQTFYNNTDSAYAHFNWALNPSDVNNQARCFIVTIKDNSCPYIQSNSYNYCIKIRGLNVRLGSDTLLCEGESATFYATADATTSNYIWKLNNVPTGTPQNQDHYTFNSSGLNPGIYKLRVETNDGNVTLACPGIDELNINLVYQPHLNLPDRTFLVPTITTYNAGPGANYIWSDVNNYPIGIQQYQTIYNQGTYTVYVDGGNGTRCSDFDTFKVKYILSGLEEDESIINVSENYPNPAKDYTLIDVELVEVSNTSIQITDICGRKVLEKDFGKLPNGKSTIEIPLEGIAPGLYFYSLVIGNERVSKKMVVE